MKTRQQNPEFGPKPGEIQKKNLQKMYISLQGVLTPSMLFHERLHCCYIYFHCSYLYNYYNYLEPCALNAGFQAFDTQI